MGESHHQQATTSSRLGMMRTVGGGEIVEVQGGHIVRSTGRKDRHSKVCTAKGPRDRRVRLSAHTAIQFYDVQDRLGYDRPSKAVDWLIKKAQAAIDELAELPAWNPNTNTNACSSTQNPNAQPEEGHTSEKSEDHIISVHRETTVDDAIIASGSRRSAAATTTMVGGGGRISEQFPQQLGDDNNNNKYNSGGFLPPSLDTDIADTIKSFFPMVAAAETTTSFHNYPPPPDLLSRTTSSSSNQSHQDLRLSLQSFQDPILLHHHHQQQQQHHHHQNQTQHHNEQGLFAGTAALGFDGGSSGAGWSEQQQHPEEHEHGRLHRMVAWNAAAAAAAAADTGTTGHGAGGGGGFIFNAPSPTPASLFGHGQHLSQRGPLQSSNTPSIRAWMDPAIATATINDHHHYHHHHHYLSPAAIHQSSVSGGIGFAASGGFSGFRIPTRIQGEEEHDGVSDKPSSASSDSRH